MGRPPSKGGSQSLRFSSNEIAMLEEAWSEHESSCPSDKTLMRLAENFSKAREKEGRPIVQLRQVARWFTDKKKETKKPSKTAKFSSLTEEIDITKLEFEAKSAKDGGWYDVGEFVEHRVLDSGDTEVRVRFAGYGPEDDEWVNVKAAVRLRFCHLKHQNEGNERALYYDAYVIDVERRKHDIRGCRCRFMVQYGHDGSTGVLQLKKLSRRNDAESISTDNVSSAGTTNTDSSKQKSGLSQVEKLE